MPTEQSFALPDPDPARALTPEAFGRELSAAKERTNLTVRQIAQHSGVPASSVQDYLSGRHLPQIGNTEQLVKMLIVLGEGAPDRRAAWMAALARVRRVPGRRPVAAACPYRGLASFREADAPWFHGRRELTALVIERLLGAGQGSHGPLIVVGASGAGKSSLLYAGVIPALKAKGFRCVALVPGNDPVGALHGALNQVSATEDGLLVVDQLEELFATEVSTEQRRKFLQELDDAARREDGSRLRVALVLRADFYPQALEQPQLARALQTRQILVGPMTAEQLRQAITEPARQAGTDIEPSLIDVLVQDLAFGVVDTQASGGGGAGAAHGTGALPLLSHALQATWTNSRGSRLTVADYLSSGGIRDAIANSAETVYTQLSAAEKRLTRWLLLRLVRVTADAPVTRRTVLFNSLRGSGFDEADLEQVLDRFVRQRLLTADNGTVYLTHEAVLTAWPRLGSWLASDRAGLVGRQRMSEAAQAWAEGGRDPHELLRGTRLALARERAADPLHSGELTAIERDFLDSSLRQQTTDETRERRIARRLRVLTAALTALVLVSGAAAGYAFKQKSIATSQRDSAVSRQTAIEADQLRKTDVALAAQLAIAAYRIDPTLEARSSVLDASLNPAVTRINAFAGVMQAVAVTRNGQTMAIAGARGIVQLWDLGVPGRPRLLTTLRTGRNVTFFTAAFSPDGHTLAAAGAAGTILTWQVGDPTRPLVLTPADMANSTTVYSLAFSPDGRMLAVGGSDDAVRLLLDDAGHWRTVAVLTGFTDFVQAVAFSPDGRGLAAASADSSIRWWRIIDRLGHTAMGTTLTGPHKAMYALAFAPGSGLLAAAGRDNAVWLWRIDTATGTALPGRSAAAATWVNALAFSTDGRVLAEGGGDSEIRLWDAVTLTQSAILPAPAPVTGLAYLPDGTARLWRLPGPVSSAPGRVFSTAFGRGHLLFVGSESDTVSVWDTSRPGGITPVSATVRLPADASKFSGSLALAANGRTLAVGSNDGTIRLWGVTDPARATLLPTILTGLTTPVESIAFSPNGRTLAAGANENDIRLWDVTDPEQPRPLPALTGPTNYVFAVAFSLDSRILAAGSADGTARMWNVTDPADPVVLGSPLHDHTSYVYTVAFSPDGHILATGSADDTVSLWDITRPTQPTKLGAPLSGPDNYVYSVAFSPDGRTIVATGGDGSVWLWDITHPAQPSVLAALRGLTGSVYTSAFSPYDPLLAAGGEGSQVAVWNTNVNNVIAGICAEAGTPITKAEWTKYIPDVPYSPPCPQAR